MRHITEREEHESASGLQAELQLRGQVCSGVCRGCSNERERTNATSGNDASFTHGAERAKRLCGQSSRQRDRAKRARVSGRSFEGGLHRRCCKHALMRQPHSPLSCSPVTSLGFKHERGRHRVEWSEGSEHWQGDLSEARLPSCMRLCRRSCMRASPLDVQHALVLLVLLHLKLRRLKAAPQAERQMHPEGMVRARQLARACSAVCGVVLFVRCRLTSAMFACCCRRVLLVAWRCLALV